MEMGQDNSSSGIWETGQVWMSSKGWVEGVGRGNGLRTIAGVVARGHYRANVDADQGAGWETELCVCVSRQVVGHARPGGGGGGRSVRRAPVEVPASLILRLRPNCARPRARYVAPIRGPRRKCRSAVAWGCPATHLRARLSSPSLYSPFSECPCATGFTAQGSRVDERREGRGGKSRARAAGGGLSASSWKRWRCV
jgi:hypothetical protein